jgi:integrase
MSIHKLTPGRLAQARKTNGMHGDGGNLWLQVTNGGAGQSWVFRWTDRITKRDRVMGLGSAFTITINEARELARTNCRLLLERKDPQTERDGARIDAEHAAGLAKTLKQVRDEFYKAKMIHRRKGTQHLFNRGMDKYVIPYIGDMPIRKVTRADCLDKTPLRKMWGGEKQVRRHVTAVRVLGYLQRIFSFAIEQGYLGTPKPLNPLAWEGLKHVLPESSSVHKTVHYPSLSHRDVYGFLQSVRAHENHGGWQAGHPNIALLLEFVVLTAVRPNEARLATWDQFDLPHRIWTVPPENMKEGNENRTVAITKSMLAVLGEMKMRRFEISPNAYVFPSTSPRVPAGTPYGMSSLPAWINRFLDWDIKFTPHGFRSTLKDWALANRYPIHLWEIQVAHKLGNQTSQSYGKYDLLEERREMMEAYDSYCNTPPAPESASADNIVSVDEWRNRQVS